MTVSFFDLFSIGIGPSSSHTVGPMRCANAFCDVLIQKKWLHQVHRVQIDLYGSLALTGIGHGTDKAILNGLEGHTAEAVNPESMIPRMQTIIKAQTLNLSGQHDISFNLKQDLVLHQKESLPKHSNGLTFSAFDQNQNQLIKAVYYSIGGGFITTEEAFGSATQDHQGHIPYPYDSAKQLLSLCEQHHFSIAELTLQNELAIRKLEDIQAGMLKIADIMMACIKHGCHHEGTLPGGLHVKRRAPDLYKRLRAHHGIKTHFEKEDLMSFVNLYAMAVNEENAAGGRVVTAPTNGAAGIIPAILKYIQTAHHKLKKEDIYTYFLTASAIGSLFKEKASISGAEVGCQGEIGVASSMAAAGLTAVLGGSIYQIENAAEIAMEHHLGMTCDPVKGLVQIPCIERNAMGAIKAINAARLALIGDGTHFIPLDNVIQTMLQTGQDMQSIYKETSLGGLAVNFPEC